VLVLSRFVFRRSLKPAVAWAVALGIYVASKSEGLIKAYPTLASRLKLAHSFSSNSSLEVLVGPAHHLETVAGYVNWNCLQISVLVGAIWIILKSSTWLRGDEENGRSELILSSPTTIPQATRNILIGLLGSLTLFFVVLGAITAAIGSSKSISIGVSAAYFYSLCITLCIAVFMALSALCSQIMPTRARAAGLAASLFGLSYILRAVGDITSAHWVLDITPLGWVEKTLPLVGSKPVWLVPLILAPLVLIGATLFLAGRRDLGEALVKDKQSRKPNFRLLNSPGGLVLRINRTNLTAWILGIGLSGLFYSSVTKTAISALDNVNLKGKAVHRLLGQTHLNSANAYLGIVFLIEMLVLMSFAAYLAGNLRKDEANGYLDNVLVRPISRTRLLSSRMAIGVIMILIASLAITLGTWLGVFHENLGVSFISLLKAGANISAPAILVYGVGIGFFGYLPRWTTFAAYAVLIWSFLVDILNAGLHLNHWFLDTSVINQLPLVPAVSPVWRTTITIAVVGLVLLMIGTVGFNRRDVENE